MQSRVDLESRDRAVSNVIGVVLVVGITVVLASFSAVYLMGIGQSVEQPPDNVRLATSYDDSHTGNGETLSIEHRAGNDLDAAKVHIRVKGATTTGSPPADVELTSTFASQVGSDDRFQSGETIVLDKTDFQQVGGGPVSPSLDLGDAEVRLVWRSNKDTTSSYTIYTCKVEYPDCSNRD